VIKTTFKGICCNLSNLLSSAMLKEMKEQGYRVLLYKRYIDDILAIFEHQD